MQSWLVARAAACGVALIVSAGCATQSDLAQQERTLAAIFQDQSRSIEEVSREVERLRADVEPRGPTPAGPANEPAAMSPEPSPAEMERAAKLEQRVQQLEERRAASVPIGMTLSPDGTSSEDPTATEQAMAALSARATAPPPSMAVTGARPPPPTVPQQLAALPGTPGATPPSPARAAPPPPAPPPKVPIDDKWKREVAQDRAGASTTGGLDRSAYLSALDGLARGECSTALSRLSSLSGTSASPLADNALYWRARCVAAEGNATEAVSSLRYLVSHYPKSDKAPAALWEEGQLLIGLRDTPGAREALAKLIRDYPSTTEAAEARRKLAEIAH